MPDNSASNSTRTDTNTTNTNTSDARTSRDDAGREHSASTRSAGGASGESTKPREAAKDVAHEAGSKAAEVRDKVMKETREVRDELTNEVRTIFSDGREALADQIDRLAKAFRGSKKKLEEQNLDKLAAYPKQVADGIDEVSQYLRERDAAAMRRDLDRAVSQRPGLVAGTLAAVGALSVWYLKRGRRHQGSNGHEHGSQRYRAQQYGSEQQSSRGRASSEERTSRAHGETSGAREETTGTARTTATGSTPAGAMSSEQRGGSGRGNE